MIDSESYDLDKLRQMSKEEIFKWYFNEMQRLFPKAEPFRDYGVEDAERAYRELHDGTDLVHSLN